MRWREGRRRAARWATPGGRQGDDGRERAGSGDRVQLGAGVSAAIAARGFTPAVRSAPDASPTGCFASATSLAMERFGVPRTGSADAAGTERKSLSPPEAESPHIKPTLSK